MTAVSFALLFPSRAASSDAARRNATPKIAYRTPSPLHVSGPLLKDAKGRTVRLQGVNVPSLEWSNAGDRQLPRSIEVAMKDWRANAIRLPLSQDRWFGKAEGQTDGGEAYRNVVESAVRSVSERGGYVILDLHWSDAGAWGKRIGQHKMPDPNSLLFWKDVSRIYANHPAVLFGIYNEPRDVSWDVWRNGGEVREKDDKTGSEAVYSTPGLQKLIETIREQGAKNAVVAGGLDWAYDLTGIEKGFALRDPGGNGVVYDTHIYPWKSDWEGKVGVVTGEYPVLVGEVGCEPDPKQEDPYAWAPKVLAFIDRHRLSWTAWCFHPSASPRLLSDWEYDPTPYWGRFVKDALAKR
jgi:aryl-phospho-beta-D-glucosidase BglC (GH1 family)